MIGLSGSMTNIIQFDKPVSRKEGKIFEGDEVDTVKEAMKHLVNEAKLLA